MNKEDFIETISKLSREQINDIIRKNAKPIKMIKPIIYHINK